MEAGEVQDTILLLDVAQDLRNLALGNLSTTMIRPGNLLIMEKDKRLMDYSPDFDRVEFRQIIIVRDTLEQLLSVRVMDEAVTKLFVSVRSLETKLRSNLIVVLDA